MVRVKICGITNRRDATAAVDLGAWALGFIFYKKSPRYITPTAARKIIAYLPPFVTPVGVFVNERPDAVRKIAQGCGLCTLQLHGDETPAMCRRLEGYCLIKTFHVRPGLDWRRVQRYPTHAYMFDSGTADQYGGTGKAFDWAALKGLKASKTPVILSGGLHAGNVQRAVRVVKPYAVDVCSGVEQKPRIKSLAKLKAFFKAVE